MIILRLWLICMFLVSLTFTQEMKGDQNVSEITIPVILCEVNKNKSLAQLDILYKKTGKILKPIVFHEICSTSNHVVDVVGVIASGRNKVSIFSGDLEMCGLLSVLTDFPRYTYPVTWSCPLSKSNVVQITPFWFDTARVILRLLHHYGWRNIGIVYSEGRFWKRYSEVLKDALKKQINVKGTWTLSEVPDFAIRSVYLSDRFITVLIFILDPSATIGAAQILESFQLRSSSQPVLIFLYTEDLNVPYFVHPVLLSLSNATDVFVLSHDVLHPSFPKGKKLDNLETAFLISNMISESSKEIHFKFSFNLHQIFNGTSILVLTFNDEKLNIVREPLWLRGTRPLADLSCNGTDGVCAKIYASENFAEDASVFFAVVAVLICIVLLIIVGLAIRWQLLKKQMTKGPNKVILLPEDINKPFDTPRKIPLRTNHSGVLSSRRSIGTPDSRPKSGAGSAGLRMRNNFNDNYIKYAGEIFYLKRINHVHGNFEIKSKAIKVIVMLHSLRNENINPLLGFLCDPRRPGMVFEYCSRGSLRDILNSDDLQLDWAFKESLLMDLIKGLRYLHSSSIRVHGYLTSRNCVVDSRWVLKLTDYGWPLVSQAQGLHAVPKTAKDLLWTAPELLRNESLRLEGTQSGDIYSLGIIFQEVVTREQAYGMLTQRPEEIIQKLKKPPPLIRPSVSKGAAPPEVINTMRQSWAEQPESRPEINEILETFKRLGNGKKVNIVDTMFEMLEKYSNNLEDLVRDRTEQLEQERKKTDQLLNRMLPSSVAEKLKLGLQVEPEWYEDVTIYFSDIVGFTTISAYSTPIEVVDLLNDLYTCFDATIDSYSVYKVETIGDAYMVVSGLPYRIPDHAAQVGTMAMDLLHQAGKFKIRHLPNTPLRLRIGLHTGPCCAGVVGLTMPRYCLFGDTVNTASRMESSGSAWRIHVSHTTKAKLEEIGGYKLVFRGMTELKGKGQCPTYWLEGKEGFTKELPVPPEIGIDEELVKSSLRPRPSTAERNGILQPVHIIDIKENAIQANGHVGPNLS